MRLQHEAPRYASNMKVASKPTAKAAATGTKPTGASASKRIDQRIRELGGWRGETLARMRALKKQR